MLDEESDEICTYHVCRRRDCSRIFRDGTGYSDRIQGDFDQTRVSAKACPRCGAVLYLAEVDQTHKIETWECPRTGCEFFEELPSPAAQ